MRQGYLAYGNYRLGATLPTDRKFTGQKQDGSGLYYYNARYYDPQLGTFISPDTLVPDPGNLHSYNRYLYGLGNPLRYNDPTGHQDEDRNALLPSQPGSGEGGKLKRLLDLAVDTAGIIVSNPNTSAAPIEIPSEANELGQGRVFEPPTEVYGLPLLDGGRITTTELPGGSYYTSHIGANGRLEVLSAYIEVSTIGTGIPTDERARSFAQMMGGKPGDDAGHVLAKVLGGGLVDNIVAQNRGVNRGAYAQFQKDIAAAIRETGQAASIEVNVFYADENATRPNLIIFNANVGGKYFYLPFPNP